MLVARKDHQSAIEIAMKAANAVNVGNPEDHKTGMGPVVNRKQFERIQGMIEIGVEEGAQLIAGGLGRPDHIEVGYFVRPTIFANVSNDMRIAREEIFGPVLSILPYDTVEDAIEIANDTVYGLAAYVQSTNTTQANNVASRMRAGTVYVNNPIWDSSAPFGGFKQSGNGREYADFGLDEFLEVKGIVGHGKKTPQPQV